MKPRFLLHRWGFLAFLLLLFGGACLPTPTPCTTAADCKNPSAPACFQGRCQAASCTSDLDCSDPALPSCQAGSCQPRKTACQGPLDCNDPQRPVCSQGVCQPRPSECSNDRDCPSERFFCQQGVCWLRSLPCVKDADCKDIHRPSCREGTCLPLLVCQKDGDCKEATHPRCEAGFCRRPCEGDGDCKEDQRPLCRQGACLALSACQKDSDCKEATHPRCEAGFCQTKIVCLWPSDCPKGAPFCVEGICQLHTFSCKTSADCRVKEFPLCQDGACHPPKAPLGCLRDADCTSPASPRCRSGVCSPVCRENADCPAQGASCLQGRCSRCRNDLDCAPSELCDQAVCRSSLPVFCRQDADCQRADTLGSACLSGRCFRLHEMGVPVRLREKGFWLPSGELFSLVAQGTSLFLASRNWLSLSSGIETYSGKDFCTLEAHTPERTLAWEARTQGWDVAGAHSDTPCALQRNPQGGVYWLFGEMEREPKYIFTGLRSVAGDGKFTWETRWFTEGTPLPSHPSFENWPIPFEQWQATKWKVSAKGDVFVALGRGLQEERKGAAFFQVGGARYPLQDKERPLVWKLHPDGKTAWLRFFPHPIQDLEVDDQGSLYLLGSIGTSDWSGRPIRVQGERDIYVAKLSQEGELVWVTTVGSPFLDCPKALRRSLSGALAVLGELHVKRCRESNATAAQYGSPYKHTRTQFGSGWMEHPQSPQDLLFLAQLSSEGEWMWAVPLEIPASGASPYIKLAVESLPSGRWFLASKESHDRHWQEWTLFGKRLWKAELSLPWTVQGELGFHSQPSPSSSFFLPFFFSDQTNTFPPFSPPLPALPPFASSGFLLPLLSLDGLGGSP